MDSISCEEIFRMTQQVWTPMLSFPLKLKPERPTGTALGGESVVGSVSLNGDWQGAVTLEFSQSSLVSVRDKSLGWRLKRPSPKISTTRWVN